MTGMLFLVLVAALCTDFASSLSPKEASLFHNSGKYGGFLQVDVKNDRIDIATNGVPDHPIYSRMLRPSGEMMNYSVSLSRPMFARMLPGCLPWGPIGLTTTGVPFYHPLDTSGRNLVEGNQALGFDKCDGVFQNFQYRYYGLPTCLYKGEVDELLGVAFDGNPIYGPKVSFLDREVTSADLDMCHGKYFNGSYAYFITSDFPYTLGCYKSMSAFNTETEHVCSLTQSSSSLGYICLCSQPEDSDDDDNVESSADGQTPIGNGHIDIRPNPVPKPTPGLLLPQTTGGNKPTTEAVNIPLPPRPFPGNRPFPGFPGGRPLPVGLTTPKPTTVPEGAPDLPPDLPSIFPGNAGPLPVVGSTPKPNTIPGVSQIFPGGPELPSPDEFSTSKPKPTQDVTSSDKDDSVTPYPKPSVFPMPKPTPVFPGSILPMPKPSPGQNLSLVHPLPVRPMPKPSPSQPDKPQILPEISPPFVSNAVFPTTKKPEVTTQKPKPEVTTQKPKQPKPEVTTQKPKQPKPEVTTQKPKQPKPEVTTQKPKQPWGGSGDDNTDNILGGSGLIGTSASSGLHCKIAVVLLSLLLSFVSNFAI